jgi:signal transduction histidine kinase
LQVAIAHGGTIEYVSEPGKGTTFKDLLALRMIFPLYYFF